MAIVQEEWGYGSWNKCFCAHEQRLVGVDFIDQNRRERRPFSENMALRNPEIKYTKLFINNEFVDAISKKAFATINPATERKIADVAEGQKEDVDAAVAAARAAFKRGSDWRTMDASARGKLIYKLAQLIERDITYLASLESLDNGKPYNDAVFDINCAIDTFKYYAGWPDKIQGSTMNSDWGVTSMTRKQPVGVVGQIIPWNYPILMLSWKWGPALACGCTIVLKPAEQTPLTALAVAALAKEAGFPAGVINVINGFGPTTGQAIALHPRINKVAFTGSTEVGHMILSSSAGSNLKRVSLELGGKSPLVVFNDCDLSEAVEIAHNAIFANHGQNCCAGSRTYVQSGVYDAFVAKATEMAKARKVGDPFAGDVQQGPQVDKQMLDKVLGLIEKGKIEGARCTTGGARHGQVGFFVQPTVFADVKDNMAIARQEIFGPVQSIFKFDTLEEVIERANDTDYGLAAGCITKDLNTAMTFAQAVDAGSVWINCYDMVVPQVPFGGFKKSGMGRELGEDGLHEYLETKTVTMKLTSTF